jgi:hypothetical protein
MLKNQQFVSVRGGNVPAATFWRAHALVDQTVSPPVSALRFDTKGKAGLLGVPVETGLLCVAIYGERQEAQFRDTLPGALDGLIELLGRHHGVDRDSMSWLYIGAEDGLVNVAAPVRSGSARVVSIRIRPLRTGVGRGGDLRDVAFVYGQDAAFLVRSALLHFPRLGALSKTLPVRERAAAHNG